MNRIFSKLFVVAALVSASTVASAQMTDANKNFYGFENYQTTTKGPGATCVKASDEGIEAKQGSKVMKIDGASGAVKKTLWAKPLGSNKKANLIKYNTGSYKVTADVYVTDASPKPAGFALNYYIADPKKAQRCVFKMKNVARNQWVTVEGKIDATSIPAGEVSEKSLALYVNVPEGGKMYIDNIQVSKEVAQ